MSRRWYRHKIPMSNYALAVLNELETVGQIFTLQCARRRMSAVTKAEPNDARSVAIRRLQLFSKSKGRHTADQARSSLAHCKDHNVPLRGEYTNNNPYRVRWSY